MRIVCGRAGLSSLIFSEMYKNSIKMSSAAVVITVLMTERLIIILLEGEAVLNDKNNDNSSGPSCSKRR